MGKKEVVDMELYVHHHTEKAVLVSLEADSAKTWLPRSQIEMDDWRVTKQKVNITLPTWLAERTEEKL